MINANKSKKMTTKLFKKKYYNKIQKLTKIYKTIKLIKKHKNLV